MNIPSINASSQADSLMASTAGTTRTRLAEDAAAANTRASGISGAPTSMSADLVTGGTAASSDALGAKKPTPLEQVQQAMEDVRNAIAPVAQDLLFSIDEDTGKTIVKVVDASTDEVIRQIPSEEIISIAKALDKLQGLLVEQKA